ncbi:hypothetical protein DFH09DRAFT_1326901 [Mycena vulgaris]|nr:hypothetical protein DFH09DRAFT_1326901 [Mycena vulgaris]
MQALLPKEYDKDTGFLPDYLPAPERLKVAFPDRPLEERPSTIFYSAAGERLERSFPSKSSLDASLAFEGPEGGDPTHLRKTVTISDNVKGKGREESEEESITFNREKAGGRLLLTSSRGLRSDLPLPAKRDSTVDETGRSPPRGNKEAATVTQDVLIAQGGRAIPPEEGTMTETTTILGAGETHAIQVSRVRHDIVVMAKIAAETGDHQSIREDPRLRTPHQAVVEAEVMGEAVEEVAPAESICATHT